MDDREDIWAVIARLRAGREPAPRVPAGGFALAVSTDHISLGPEWIFPFLFSQDRKTSAFL